MDKVKIAEQLVTIAKSLTAGDTEQRELELYIINDSDLHRRHVQPIIKNLQLKVKRGVYDREKAVKLFMYLADAGAKKYHKEFGSPDDMWSDIFPKRDRQAVAEELRNYYEEEIMEGMEGITASSKTAGSMGFDEWADINLENDLRNPEDIADAIKQFGFDWVSGEGDTNDINLKDVASYIDEEVWDLMSGETSQLLINKLKSHVKKFIAGELLKATQEVACDCENCKDKNKMASGIGLSYVENGKGITIIARNTLIGNHSKKEIIEEFQDVENSLNWARKILNEYAENSREVRNRFMFMVGNPYLTTLNYIQGEIRCDSDDELGFIMFIEQNGIRKFQRG
jgi:predicted RNase H-related nuclease YkuK (DUF458 family)